MIMRILHLVLLLWMPLTGYSQGEFLARLPVSGAVSELGISPSEEIWVGTRAGNVYYTKQIGGLWHFGPFTSKDEYSLSITGSFDRVSFFSKDTMMISGFIHGENGNQDFIYHSVDHGKTWNKVRFGNSSWLDAAYVNKNGKAWLSGSSQFIYHTSDYGKTWKTFPKVEQTGNLRFSTIYFACDEKTGLFGSFWNVLYRTSDNCISWEKLPTPLSQGKYTRLSKHDRPVIRKVRMFGGYYIINQQGRVFITKSDSINWEQLNNIIDFEVTESDRLYVIKQDRFVELYDSNFKPIWKSESKLKANPTAIAVRNESLFALTHETVYKVSPEVFISSDLYTDEVPIPEPYATVKYGGEVYGFQYKDILRYDKKSKSWYRYMTADFPIGNATVFDNRLLIADANLKQYYALDEQLVQLTRYDLPKSLFDTSQNSIAEFHIETGSQGCFHSDNSRRSYIRKSGRLILDTKRSTVGYLSSMPNEIDSNLLRQFIETVDESRFQTVSFTSLQISDRDISEFKRYIDREEKRIKKTGIDKFKTDDLYAFLGENTDFGFYKNVADSLSYIADEVIDQAFMQDYGNWSTTTEWRRVIFVFQDGKKLIVESSSDKPNYLHSPWTVDFEGLKLKSNSIHFGRMVDKLTRGDFLLSVAAEKNYALFKIADFLYRRKVKQSAY
ncbi:YCF48-related protein [Pontibacter sp. H249]|uniref:YCF48-related protein n=1 Tax=Pontibacter sp. H249 TaxID=3133420 RepID=UPI0030C1640D